MNKEDILKILEGAKDKSGDVPMRLVRQAFEKLPEPCTDTISRQAAIDALADYIHNMDKVIGTGRLSAYDCKDAATNVLAGVPSAQPDNQVNLCDSCKYSYPDCPSEANNVIFGNGKGNDNICACNKYLPSAQPEPKWIPCSERLPEEKDTRILKKLGINKQSDHVLTTVKVKGECMTVRACTYDGVWDWDMKHAFPDCEIIAWMPLPEPYAERQEG